MSTSCRKHQSQQYIQTLLDLCTRSMLYVLLYCKVQFELINLFIYTELINLYFC